MSRDLILKDRSEKLTLKDDNKELILSNRNKPLILDIEKDFLAVGEEIFFVVDSQKSKLGV